MAIEHFNYLGDDCNQEYFQGKLQSLLTETAVPIVNSNNNSESINIIGPGDQSTTTPGSEGRKEKDSLPGSPASGVEG